MSLNLDPEKNITKGLFKNIEMYEGEVSFDYKEDSYVPNGEGKITYKNGSIFEGKWINGKEIEGTITFLDGTQKKLENDILSDLSDDISNENKPEELKSVKIIRQKYEDCWAHSVSRNFVRTFQILDIIKSKYVNQFYDLFYTILTIDISCDGGGISSTGCLYLLDYIKNNYRDNIFNITYNLSECNKGYNYSNNIILELNEEDKKKLISDLDYLFCNDLLFIGYHEYIGWFDKPNNPTLAIKTMLNFKLQPCVKIIFSYYLDNFVENPSNSFPSIPNWDYGWGDDDVFDKKKCVVNTDHIINLRKWMENGVEFKNSWGVLSGNDGNFSVSDLKYVLCKNEDNSVNEIIFVSLMFDYDKMNNYFKDKINNKLCLYRDTFDNNLNTKESEYYTGEYNKYGLFDGVGKNTYSNGDVYNGQWKNGFRDGKGIMNYSNSDDVYEGEWKNNNIDGKGIMNYSDGGVYDGEWKNGFRDGKGKMNYSNNDVYDGEWKNNYMNGKGKMNLASGDVYDGEWKNNNMDGKGKMNLAFGDVYNGEWKKCNMDGKGIMNYSSGNVYVGEWKNGEMDGKGKMNYSTGGVYDGEWKNSLRDGQGIMNYSNGNVHDGEWKDDKPIYTNKQNGGNILNINYKEKYIKYKNKYLKLKNNILWK